MDNSEYTVEYKFTANTKDLEEGVSKVRGLIEKAKDTAKDFGEQLSGGAYQAIGSINDLDGKTQALLASITALEVAFAKSSLDAFAQYEDAMYGMATTVGNVGGTIDEAMESIRETTASGLLSETDAARAINNLTSYGFSVQQATDLIRELTNVSMAHRNEQKSVGEQVEALTEGIKRGSTQMLKANGLMVTGTDANAAYAVAIGKTASELDKSEKAQALYNAVVQEGESSAAVASIYQESYSAATQRLSNAMEDLKGAFGQVLAPIATFVANVASWMVANKQLVAGLLTFVGVIAGAGGIAVALAKLIPLIGSAIAWFNGLQVATKGLVIGLAIAAGALAVVAATSASLSNSLGDVVEQTQKSGDASDDASESSGNLAKSLGGVGGAAKNTAKDLEKLRRQYLDELKQLEVRHNETINRLTKQIQDANVDYRRAIDERNAEFAVSQAKEEKKHQEKVDDIMTQIAFLQRYNNDYNKQKLANLEFALAKENALYQKQTEAAKEELELQNKNDRQAYETKRAELQAELDEELAFMNKHREDLKEVQNWILLDEIESLKQRYEEQKKSYSEQAIGAGVGGANVGESFISNLDKAISDYTPQISATGGDLGSVFGDTFAGKAFKVVDEFFNGMLRTAQNIIKAIISDMKSGFSGEGGFVGKISNALFGWMKPTEHTAGWATGGYTGQGNPNEVAGVVHKGEYVLPQELVDQRTGTQKALGNTYVINVTGTFATSAAERRKVADQIVTAINQNNKSRLEASWQ